MNYKISKDIKRVISKKPVLGITKQNEKVSILKIENKIMNPINEYNLLVHHNERLKWIRGDEMDKIFYNKIHELLAPMSFSRLEIVFVGGWRRHLKAKIQSQCKQCFLLTDKACIRIGQCGSNEGKLGVCWMDRSEGEL